MKLSIRERRILSEESLVDRWGEKSIVTKANTKSSSVRTTISEKIVQEMEIAVGDVLDWETTMQGGRKVVRVKKLE